MVIWGNTVNLNLNHAHSLMSHRHVCHSVVILASGVECLVEVGMGDLEGVCLKQVLEFTFLPLFFFSGVMEV